MTRQYWQRICWLSQPPAHASAASCIFAFMHPYSTGVARRTWLAYYFYAGPFMELSGTTVTLWGRAYNSIIDIVTKETLNMPHIRQVALHTRLRIHIITRKKATCTRQDGICFKRNVKVYNSFQITTPLNGTCTFTCARSSVTLKGIANVAWARVWTDRVGADLLTPVECGVWTFVNVCTANNSPSVTCKHALH